MAKGYLVVTNIERQYMILESDLDGRPIEEVLEEWFKDFPIHRDHATRSFCHIGGSDKVKEYKIVKELELTER